MTHKRNLAIIGIGPRGFYALENLILDLLKSDQLKNIHILLFEMTGKFGIGHVYDLEQSETNWINITERIVTINGREEIKKENFYLPKFPSYHEFINKDFSNIPKTNADIYPPRAAVGNYFHQRFQTLITPLLKADLVTLKKEKVEDIKIQDDKISLKTKVGTYHEIDEVLLTIGHQPTELSEQIATWEKFAKDNTNTTLFKSPYPISQFIHHKNLTPKSKVGIRGFGLAMIDVARGIADKFGKFSMVNDTTKKVKYHSSHDISNMIMPFSLDGLPPSPKPLNAQIDEWFKPTEEQIATFEKLIGNAETQKAATSPLFLVEAITPIIADIYAKLPLPFSHENLSHQEIKNMAQEWLLDQKYQHPIIVSPDQATEKTMQDFVKMATGEKPISLDFCIGQVWRHCQPSIYEQLSFNQCSDEVVAEIVALDESTKRYSYGPPVESIQQMLALVEAGVMTLEVVNDPEIALTEKGWCMKSATGKTFCADLMIDSVLDSPKIKLVNSSIVKKLFAKDLIQAVHDDLGILTDENGYIISNDKNKNVPIALLGRLAKGTIIGVDAILECFGSRPKKWAAEAANRHVKWLKEN